MFYVILLYAQPIKHSSLPKVLIPRHPVRSLFVLKLLAVNLALALGVQNGIVAVSHEQPVENRIDLDIDVFSNEKT